MPSPSFVHGHAGAGGSSFGGGSGGDVPPGQGGTGGPPPGEYVSRMRRAALASAIYHSHRRREHERIPYVLQPLPLDEAVAYLRSDPDPRMRLHAAAWLMDNPQRHSLTEPGTNRFLPELEALVGNAAELDGVQEEMRGKAPLLPALRWDDAPSISPENGPDAEPDLPPPQGKGDTHTLADELSVQETRYSVAASWLLRQLGGNRRCDRENFGFVIRFSTQTLVTSVRASVDVERPYADFNSIADPQDWKRNVPLFFAESDLGRFDGNEFVPQGGMTRPDGTYDRLLLRERVSLSINPLFPILGQNILVASHKRKPEAPTCSEGCGMEVSLYVSESTTIGASTAKGGIDVDDGSVSAVVLGPTSTRLFGSKRARFTERSLCGIRLGRALNWFAPFSLGPWMALLVFEGACFEVDPAGQPPPL